MRSHTVLSLLLPAAALACSGPEPSPTELRPEFAVTCSPPKATVTASPNVASVVANSSGSAKFFVKNNCTVTLTGLTFTSSRSGAVSSVGAPSPATRPQLAPGATVTVFVGYSVGASGSGTVVLTATTDFGDASSGSQTITVTGGPGASGVPFGPFSAWSGPSTPRTNTSVFSMGVIAEDPHTIVERLGHSATIGKKVMPAITGGNHNRYKTPPDISGRFDYAKWKARVDTFNTTAIKTAVTNAFNNGTLVGFNMLDEPQADDWHNSHTKQLIDQMATYMKSIFGAQIPMGISVTSNWHLADPKYQVLDFINTQYEQRFGSVTAWRNTAFTNVASDKVKIVFSLNVLNGGAGLNETPATCNANPATGGPSPVSSSRCSMGGGPGGQIETFGTQVMQAEPGGKKGVGLTLWDYNATYFDRPEMESAFATVAGVLNAAPRQSWLRYP